MSKTYSQLWDEAIEQTADLLAGERQPDANGLAKAKVARWACLAAWTVAVWKLWPVSHWASLAVGVAIIYTFAMDSARNKIIYAVRDRRLLQRRKWVTDLIDHVENQQ